MLTYPMFFYLVLEQKENREKNLIRFNIHKNKIPPITNDMPPVK